METILTAILWFVLGAIVGITALFRIVAYLIHNKKWYQDAMKDPNTIEEAHEEIESFFYGSQSNKND